MIGEVRNGDRLRGAEELQGGRDNQEVSEGQAWGSGKGGERMGSTRNASTGVRKDAASSRKRM